MEEKKHTCTFEPRERESILYVDDALDLAELVKTILECKGYDVVLKTSGIEALEEFRKDPQKFDLLVTGISVPEVLGDGLPAKIMKIRSDIPIIVCTGDSEVVSEEKVKKMGIRTLLQKPFSLGILAGTIQKVLASGRQNPGYAGSERPN